VKIIYFEICFERSFERTDANILSSQLILNFPMLFSFLIEMNTSFPSFDLVFPQNKKFIIFFSNHRNI